MSRMDNTQQILQWAAGLGVGGILAAFIFVVSFRYMTQQIAEGKEDKKILIDLVANTNIVITKNTTSTDNNTAALGELRREIAQNHRGRGRD